MEHKRAQDENSLIFTQFLKYFKHGLAILCASDRIQIILQMNATSANMFQNGCCLAHHGRLFRMQCPIGWVGGNFFWGEHSRDWFGRFLTEKRYKMSKWSQRVTGWAWIPLIICLSFKYNKNMCIQSRKTPNEIKSFYPTMRRLYPGRPQTYLQSQKMPNFEALDYYVYSCVWLRVSGHVTWFVQYATGLSYVTCEEQRSGLGVHGCSVKRKKTWQDTGTWIMRMSMFCWRPTEDSLRKWTQRQKNDR